MSKKGNLSASTMTTTFFFKRSTCVHRQGRTEVQQTQRPQDQCLLCNAWKASRCDLRSPKFRKFSALCMDNWSLHCFCIDVQPLHCNYFKWPKLKCFHHPCLAQCNSACYCIAVICLNLNPPSKILDPLQSICLSVQW